MESRNRGEGTPSDIIDRYIKQLHRYNEIKDAAQIILGKVSWTCSNERVTKSAMTVMVLAYWNLFDSAQNWKELPSRSNMKYLALIRRIRMEHHRICSQHFDVAQPRSGHRGGFPNTP